MSGRPQVSVVVPMEGQGAYNRTAVMQAAGAATAAPFLVEAARFVNVAEDVLLVVADYGSAQGKNSLVPVREAITALRSRVGSDRSISVVHIDQPDNDFATLFATLNDDPESYLLGQQAVFPAAVGRSFHQPVLPPNSVTLGWCANAAHWLSRVPLPIPDAWHVIATPDENVRSEFERQAADDWLVFLESRATELQLDGRLVVYLMTRPEDGSFGWDLVLSTFGTLAGEFLHTDLAARFPLASPVFPTVVRSKEELLAPFNTHAVSNLELEHYDAILAPDPIWNDYQVDADAGAFGRRWAALLRALATSLASAFPESEQSGFLDWYEARTSQLLAANPGPMNMWFARLVCRRVGVS